MRKWQPRCKDYIRSNTIILVTFSLRMEYKRIAKGRGHLYVNCSHIYRQVKKLGQTRYLRCYNTWCPGSAKLEKWSLIAGKPHGYSCDSTFEIERHGLSGDSLFTKRRSVLATRDYDNGTLKNPPCFMQSVLNWKKPVEQNILQNLTKAKDQSRFMTPKNRIDGLEVKPTRFSFHQPIEKHTTREYDDDDDASVEKRYMLVDERIMDSKKSPEENVQQKFTRPDDVLKSGKQGYRNDEIEVMLKTEEH